jgi:hypothetical protein
MGGSSNQSVDRTTLRPSGNITYTSHLCPFNLPTSSLSTILDRGKAIILLSLMVLVFHFLKRARLHLRRRRRKKKRPHSHTTCWLRRCFSSRHLSIHHLDLSLSSPSLTSPSSLPRFCSLIVRLLTLPSSPLILHSLCSDPEFNLGINEF